MHQLKRASLPRWTNGVFLLAVMLAAVGVGCSTHAGEIKERTALAPALAASATPVALTPSTTQRRWSIADVAERSLPAVVNVSTTKVIHTGAAQLSPFLHDPFFRHFFGGGPLSPNAIPRDQRERSLGSGVVIDQDGTILTNNHVVAHADEIKVTLADKREIEATVVGTDPKSDLAVIKLKKHVDGLSPLRFGDSNRLRLGEVVIAIGNPFGVGQTVTMGIVSAKGRANVGLADYEDFIQTDAAINPGNSGGALINMEGELVGINTAILSRSGGYQGIGFAIPSNMAKPIAASLKAHGKVVRGWLGVAIQDLKPEVAKALGVATQRGVLISDVTSGSPAEKAGLKRGDVAVAVNGEALDAPAHLRNLVAAAGAGATIELKVMRGSAPRTFRVVLGELPARLGGGGILKEDAGALGGLTVKGLDEASRKKYDVPTRIAKGVVVDDVAEGSRAAAAGLRQGDVIVEINRRPVDDVGTFDAQVKQSKGDLLLLVYRQGSTLYVLLSNHR